MYDSHKDKINPNFRTNPKDYSKVEKAKINSNELEVAYLTSSETTLLKIYHGNQNKLQNHMESI